MKKRIVSALLALVLIISNFTGGGLIEHVHVEAAAGTEWVSIPEVNVSIVRNFWGSNDDLVVDAETGKITMKTGTMMGWKIPTGVYDGVRFVISAIKGGTNEDGSPATFGGKICITGKDATGADYTDDNNQVKYLGDVDSETTYEFKFEEGAAATDVAIQRWGGSADSYVIVKEILLHKRPQPEFTPGKESLLIDKTVTFQRNEWGYYQRPLFDYCDTDLSKFIYAIQQPNAKVTIDFGVESAEWIQLLWKQVYSPEKTGEVTWCGPVSEINGADLYNKIDNYTHTYDEAGNTTVFNDNTSYLVMHPAVAEDVTEMTVNIKVTADVPEPDPEPEPEPVPKPVAPEGYEIVYELDMTSANITPGYQGVNGDNAAIAEALKKDGAYVEFITCYPGANTGWIQIDFENGEYIQYNNYNTEIRTEMAGTDRTSIVRLPNGAVLDAIKQAEEKSTTIKGISLAAANYEPETEADTAKENKCLGLFIYAKIPGDEPDEPCTHPEESREWKSDAENHWQVCKKCGEEVPETKKPHDALTYEELDSEKHTVKCSTCGYSGEEEHSWDGGKTVEATETEKGYILYTCEKCKAEKKVETAHVHNGGGEWKKDETSHWHECTLAGCTAEGGIYDKADHQYKDGKCETCQYEHKNHTPKAGTYKDNGDTHTYVCDVCGATVTEGHKIVKVSDDPSGHYDKCEFCDYQTKPEPHTGYELIPGDFINHYVKCSCGYTAKEAHTPGADYEKEDDDARYHICTKCGGRCDPAYHDYTVYVDDENGETHHIVCSGCGHVKPNSTEKHVYENGVCKHCEYAHADHDWKWTPDVGGTTHTRTCSICHKTETKPHNLPEKWTLSEEDETKHCKTCPDCGYTVTETHTFGAWTYADENSHVQTCECGAEKKGAHDYVYTEDTVTDTHHWQICSVCNHETEPQDHHYEGDSDRCSDCNYWNHQHQLEWRSNDTQHWQECVTEGCDYVTGRENHGFGDMTANETSHVQTCSKCGKTVVQKHQFEGYSFNTGMHWHECSVCQYKTDYNVHTLNDASDATSHWQECTAEGCDYETEHETHIPSEEYGQSDTQHWSVCTECGAEYNKSEHTIADDYKHDADSHWKYCEVCGKEETKSDHVWDTGEVTVEPTETTEGEKLFTCTECGETKTETVSKLEHTHVAGEEWKSDEKTHWHECVSETCDDKTAKLDEAAHTEDEGTVTKAATEAEEGVMTFKCTVCGAVTRTEAIPKVKHTHVAGKEWKFDEKTHWHECVSETCDDKTAKLDEAAHTEDEGTVTKAATETEEGVMTYKCTVCGAVTRTESIPKVKHTHVAGKEWKHDEKTHWHECVSETCDDKTAKLDEGEHVWDDGKVTVEPTYTKEGEKLYTCEVCGETKTETVSKLEHTHVAGEEWKSDEKTHWHECVSETCDDKTAKLDEAAHTEDEGTVTKAATEAEEGVMTYKCTVCGAVTRTESIPKVKHTHVAGKEWKHDEKTHWHECVSETCDDKTAKLDEAAHTEDEGTVTKAATETEEGVKTYKCTVCGAVTRTETIPKVTHTHVAGKEWKHDEKTHWHECVSETCDDKTAKLDEAEHVWDDGKITVEPTYTKKGEKLYTCEVCGETKTETVPIKGHEHSTVTKSDENGHWEECTICSETVGEVEAHTPGEWITDSEATSTEAGRRHKECTVCGYVTDVLVVPATGDIDVEVPTVGNVPKVELPAEQQEVLKNAIIDEEDVEAIESGASIDIELTVENAEGTIAPEDKAKSDEAAAQGSYTHVRYLDINLTKVVTDASGASTSEEISELGKEVRIVITVPLGLARQSGRDFAVIRVHDGEATVLKDLDSDPNTVTISTNLFSSYTLVYVDTTPVPSTPGGMIGHAHVITGLQNDAHYHWRGCFICSMRVDYEPHRFVDGVCTVCHYRDSDYVPEVEEEEPAEAPDTEVTVVDAPAEGTEQGGDSEGTPEVTDTPADLPETEAEVVEVKEDDVTSENPKTGVVFTGIGAVMAALAALVAKRK